MKDIIIDTELRVLQPEAYDPGFLKGTNEPVRKVLHEHPDFHIVQNQMNIEATVESMERNNIKYGLLHGMPWQDKEILNATNVYMQECVKLYPKRFRAFYLPDPTNIKQAVKEIENLDESIFVGVELIPKWQKIHIDDPELHPIFEIVRERNFYLQAYTAHLHHTLSGDTAHRTLRFLQNNLDLKVLIPHLGGLLCIYGLLPEIRDTIKNAYFITSVTSTMQMVKFAAEVNEDNLIFGSDFPLNHCHDQETPLKYLQTVDMESEAKHKLLW